jgi:tetratricopeptide (TPR) repeat protein
MPLYQRALGIDITTWGIEDPRVSRSLVNLARPYATQGKYDKAAPLLERAFEIDKQKLPPNHPQLLESLTELADAYQAQGKIEEAERLYRQGLNAVSADPVKDAKLEARLIRSYATLLRRNNMDKEAQKLEKKLNP